MTEKRSIAVTQSVALSSRDRRLVDALAAGDTQQKAAETAGCSRATVSRRFRDPSFRQALARAEREMHSTPVRRLTAEGLAAVGRMARRSNDENATPSDRLAADARLLSAAVAALLRHDTADVAVAVTPGPPADPARSPREVLLEALDLAAERLGATDQLVSNGNGSNGGAWVDTSSGKEVHLAVVGFFPGNPAASQPQGTSGFGSVDPSRSPH